MQCPRSPACGTAPSAFFGGTTELRFDYTGIGWEIEFYDSDTEEWALYFSKADAVGCSPGGTYTPNLDDGTAVVS